MGFRISVDTGGTFTDVVIADAHGIRAIGKALTTPERIFAGMRTAIEVAAQELGLSGKALLSKTDMLIYGTTRATNATAKTAFLTTLGFRDILVLKEGGNGHQSRLKVPITSMALSVERGRCPTRVQ